MIALHLKRNLGLVNKNKVVENLGEDVLVKTLSEFKDFIQSLT